MLKSNDTTRHPQIAKPVLAALLLIAILWAVLSHGRAVDATERPSATTSGRLAAAPARLLPPAVGPFQVDDSPVITVAKEDQFPGAGAEPGETITYTIVVTNESITDALGVTLSDTIDLYTSFVDGSLRVSPMAAADAYDAVGNTRIAIAPTNGLLANDVDPDDPAPNPAFNDGLTVVAFDATSANGGDVSVSADGSFTYDPPAGFEGVDTFTYTIEDGHSLTDVGEVTITVSDVIWYVDHTAASGGDGRSHSPFDSVAAFNSTAADDPGDVIFLYEQGGGPYDNGVTLLDNQQLIGQGVDLVTTVGLTPPLGATFPGVTSNPTLNNTTADNGGNGVVLAQNNALHGLNVGDTGSAGITGANFGALTVSAASVAGSGPILDLETGTLDAAFSTLSTTGSATAGVSLTDVDGDLTAAAGSIAGTAGAAFDVNGGTVGVTYPGSISQSAAARLVQVQNRLVVAQAVRFSGNVTCDTSCTGVYVADNSGGTVNFSGGSKVLNTGGSPAVTFSNNTGAGLLFTNGGLDIDTTNGDGINATGGGVISVIGSGNHVNTTTGTGVNIANTAIGSSGVTFQSISVNGATNGIILNATGASGGFSITGDAGSAVNGSGGTLTNITGDAIQLTDTMSFAMDQLNMSSVSNHGIVGIRVDGLSVRNATFTGMGDADGEDVFSFDRDTQGDNGLVGTAVFQNLTITNFAERAIDIVNEGSGTLDLDILDVSAANNNDTFGEDAIRVQTEGSVNADVLVSGGTYDDLELDVLAYFAQGIGTNTVEVTGVTSTNGGGPDNNPNGGGVAIIGSAGSTTSFDINANSLTGVQGAVVQIIGLAGAGQTLTLNGTIGGAVLADGNTLSSDNADGIDLDFDGDPGGGSAIVGTILVQNNAINFEDDGIGVDHRDAAGTMNITIRDNTLNGIAGDDGSTADVDDGIFVFTDDDVGAAVNQLNLEMIDNEINNVASTKNVIEIVDVQNGNRVCFAATGTSISSGSGNIELDTDAAADLVVDADSAADLSALNNNIPVVEVVTPTYDSTVDCISQTGSVNTQPTTPQTWVSDAPTTAGFQPFGHVILALNIIPNSHILTDREESTANRVSTASANTGNVAFNIGTYYAKTALAPPIMPALATPGDTVMLLDDPFTLPGGETFTVTFAVTIATPLPAGVDSVQNQAAVMGSNFDDVLSVDPNPHDDFPAANGETITPLTIPADLEAAKDDGQTTAVPGAPLTYTIVVSNNGPNAIFGATVEDVFPAAVTNAAWTCEAGPGSACTLSGSGDINDTVDLAAGSAVTYTAVVTVDSAATGALANTASITETTILSDPVPANNSATDTDTLTPEVDVALAKSDAADLVVAGSGPGNLTYVITATNAGPSNASNVTISETLSLPPGVSLDSITPGAGAFISPTWTLPDLDAGQSETLTVELTVDATAAAGSDVISNTATVMGADQTLVNTGDDSVTEATSVAREADLAVTVSESADPVTAGSGSGNLTYVVTVQNLGPSDVSGVVLTDTLTLPAGVALDSVTPSGSTLWDGTDTWTVGDLVFGDSETLTLVLTVGPSTLSGTDVIGNEAVLTAVDVTETNAANNTASQTTSVDTAADLVVAKFDTPDPVAAGELLTYTVAITNNGPSDAQDVVASDTMTDALTLEGTVGCAEDPGGAPTCSLGAIPAGGAARYTITALVDSATLSTTITNTVAVASTTAEALPGDESAAITTTVHVVADLELSKVDHPDPVLAGEALTYTLTLTNHGPSQGWGVVVGDELPLSYNHTGNDCGVSYSRPDPFEWVINDMPAGTVLTCVINGTVDPGVSGVITNTAYVNAVAFVTDPDPTNNFLEEPTTVFDNLFTIGDAALSEGDSGATTFTFTISRTNTADPVSVDVATAAGTATPVADYTALPTTTVDFAAGGSLTQTVTVDVIGDAIVELDETFLVNLSNPVGGGISDGQGVGTILNDDDATLSITDVSQGEGDAGVTTFVFSVTLSAATDASLTVDYATSDDTASAAGSDYTPISDTLNFSGAAGETQTITVDVTGDTLVELDETFHVDLSNISAAGRDVTLADAQGTGAILNDDGATLNITDDAAAEGDSGTATHVFSVTLSAATDTSLTVDYATANGSATTADNDYTSTSGTLTFAGTAGETQAITVDVTGDAVVELDERFHVDLSNVSAAGRDVTLSPGRGNGTIINDDSATLTITDARHEEGDAALTPFVFTVTLSAATDTAIAVDYATADDSATVADSDYLPASGTLDFAGASGETLAITVDVQGDTNVESDELFLVALSDVAAAGRDVTVAEAQGEGAILNDDDTTMTYLPIVRAPAAPVYPDLVVDELATGGDEIRVVIRNQGAAPVADPFWVDLYVDPDSPPTAVNETWTTVGDYGAVWGVGADALPLLPGETLTLTLDDVYYEPSLSTLPDIIAAGTPLYAQVDSANAGVDVGAVLETHEVSGGAYNNIVGPVTVPADLIVAEPGHSIPSNAARMPPHPTASSRTGVPL